jgi:hypothetical protein
MVVGGSEESRLEEVSEIEAGTQKEVEKIKAIKQTTPQSTFRL